MSKAKASKKRLMGVLKQQPQTGLNNLYKQQHVLLNLHVLPEAFNLLLSQQHDFAAI